MGNWISVKEKPLPLEVWVLAYCTHFIYYSGNEEEIKTNEYKNNIMVLNYDGTYWKTANNTCGCCEYNLNVTHWQPLPKQPV